MLKIQRSFLFGVRWEAQRDTAFDVRLPPPMGEGWGEGFVRKPLSPNPSPSGRGEKIQSAVAASLCRRTPKAIQSAVAASLCRRTPKAIQSAVAASLCRRTPRITLLSLLLMLSYGAAKAQDGAAVSPPPKSNETATKKDAGQPDKTATALVDTRYRIGPGDVLEVRVLRAPELSRDAVRVDQSGMIRMPMLNDDIPAACLTEAELAENIARLYLKYKRNPHVDVFVKEFQSQPVAVIGAVRGAAQFKLQRQVRLLELMSLAGGPSESAGQTIQIVHAGGPWLCAQKNASAADNDNEVLITYNLNDTMRGAPEANPVVRPGDIIQVPNADQVYILGNVLRPLAIPLKTKEPLTISKAIAMAGGTAPGTKKDKIRIIRQAPGSSTKQEIYVDLNAIEKNRAEDIALLANDVVHVPASGLKTALRSLTTALVPNVAALPIRVIP